MSNKLKHIYDITIRAAKPATDKNERILEFVISDETRDRHGTIIPISAWKLDNYNKNGIVAYQHDTSDDIDSIIGIGSAEIIENQLIGRVEFEPADINPLADKVYKKLLFGSLKATSVGFSSKKGHWGKEERSEDPNTYYFDEAELLEFSIVNIPSNPNALKRDFEIFLESQKGEEIKEILDNAIDEIKEALDNDPGQISAERARHIYYTL